MTLRHSILQDGVRVSTSTVVQRDTNTWHFERIEVLKGPASVLFGEGVSADYAVPGTPLRVGGTVRHVSGFYTDTANTIHVDGRTTLDAAIDGAIDRRATLTLRGRNLTDAFYGEYSGYPSTAVYLGAPRSVELALRLRF